MKRLSMLYKLLALIRPTAIVAVLFVIITANFAGCSAMKQAYPDTCKNDAFIDRGLREYIKARFGIDTPIRMGIIPFTTPPNFAYDSSQRLGLGSTVARELQNEFLKNAAVPIIEVFNREDWSNKKEDFYSGNYAALNQARAAQYDIIMVGLISYLNPREIEVLTKIIDVDAGITIWYGKSTITEHLPEKIAPTEWDPNYKGTPKPVYSHKLMGEIGKCIVDGVLSESDF